MKKHEYLRRSYVAKRYLDLDWWVRTLAEFFDPPGKPAPSVPYTLVKQPWGLGCIMEDGKIEKIEDYTQGPLFTVKDELEVTPEWLPNITAPVKTRLGLLVSNTLLLACVFGKKIPYINKPFYIEDIESQYIAPRLTSDPQPGEPADLDDPDKIYVFEMLKLNHGIEMINSMMEIFTVALTEKSMLPPPGIDAYKQQLLSDPNLDLNDPVQLADFESKLKKYAIETHLRDDPSYGKFLTGKILNDSYRKQFLSLGAEGGFRKDGGITGVPFSLSDSVPLDPETYPAIVNGARAGSHSRGFETQEGGVAAKRMLAASNNYVIPDTDCGSDMGLLRYYHPWLIRSLRGRTIIVGKTQKKIESNEDTSAYLGKFVRIRSPLYCRLAGEQICKVCAGEAMGRYTTGISLPLTEISAGILTARLKAMHTNNLVVNDFDLETVFT